MMLTAETLKGVWALVTSPWDEDGRFDEATFRHDVSYQCGSGVHGLYTGGSSGEFFTMEFDEFRAQTDIFLDEVGKTGMPHQVGITATDTRGAIRRAEYAIANGAMALQVALPYFMTLKPDDILRFFEDLARACGDTPLIHYNSGYTKTVLNADDYIRLIDRTPTLIGTKLTKGDPLWLATICERAPQISHFTGEYTFVADFAAGARGIYSWLAVTNPRLAVEWYEACVGGDWARAIAIQQLVIRYKIHVKLRWHGQSDAGGNKADAAINPNIRCHPRVRPPYASCTSEDLAHARQWAAENFPELLEL